MALWTNVDEDEGKPKYLTDTEKDSVIGVDVSEVTDADSISKGLTTPGWVMYKTYTDSQGNVRHKSEVLVASRSFGTDSNSISLNDDLGIVTTNLDYPVPGSGDWRLATAALNGITYADIGVVEDLLAAGISRNSIENRVDGLYRAKYDGNLCASALNTVAQYNFNFFDELTPLKTITDTTVGWGSQTDGENDGEHNFSVEWAGYIKLDAGEVKKWNFYVESDDTCAVWIGEEARSGFDATNCLVSSSNKSLPGNASTSRSSNTKLLNNNRYYPIRIWYSEFIGGCKFQMYAINEDGTKFGVEDMQFAYNETNNGYN
jgi:hypothetical protein